MDALLEDMLTLARESEAVEEPEPIVLADVVEACWNTVETPDATLVTATELTIRADESRLQQLLENLVRNAVEHGGEGVTVTVGDLADGTGFYVEDDGRGIPADEREAVFEYGYSTTEDGTGFGLAIVEEIVEAHGWAVAATDGEAGGARFEITGVEPVA
jgi:signal transduction histidine kinase